MKSANYKTSEKNDRRPISDTFVCRFTCQRVFSDLFRSLNPYLKLILKKGYLWGGGVLFSKMNIFLLYGHISPALGPEPPTQGPWMS